MDSFFAFRRPIRGLGLLAALFWLTSAGLRAQNTGTISGTLLDQGKGAPLSFANVVVFRARDSTAYLTGAQTAADGTFTIRDLGFDTYTLRATAVGYKVLRRTVVLSADQPVVRLGTLRLTSTTTQLRGVTVEGAKALVVDNPDKKIINVAKDLTSVGGSAVNVLQNVPSVTVDPNGAVSLRGTSNVTIYIDGKPTSAAGGSTANLAQIPASSIETVEIMTNPSARYDAAGSGGIINIVLKKDKNDGYNGQVSVNAGTRGRYNTSLSLSQRKGKLNTFLQYDFRQEPFRISFTGKATTTAESLTNVTEQTEIYSQRLHSHALKAGFDYTISPEQTVTFTVQPRYNQIPYVGQLDATILSTTGQQAARQSFLAAHTVERIRTTSADISLDYRHTWAAHKGRELTGNVIYSPLKTTDRSTMRQNPEDIGPNNLLQGQDIHRRFDQASAQLDYVQPIGKGRVEAGVKSSLRGTDADYRFTRFEAFDSVRSNSYLYREYIQAAYALYQNVVGKFSYQVGLRAEQSSTRGLLRTNGQRFNRDYLNFFPSFTLRQTLPHDQSVQLSYSRRINRPAIQVLLPFPDITNPRYYWLGNPRLRPELINALELAHQKSWGGATLTTTAFYRQTNDQISRAVRVIGATDAATAYTITEGTWLNVPHNTSYGLELSWNQPLTKWWRLNANGSAFHQSVTSLSNTEAAYRGFSYTSRLNTTITPVKKLDVQLTAGYNSRFVIPVGLVKSVYFLDVALKKDVLNDRGSFTLRLSDVFNTRAYNIVAQAQGIDQQFRVKPETRVGFVGFSYRFGNAQAAPAPRPRRQEQNTPSNSGW